MVNDVEHTEHSHVFASLAEEDDALWIAYRNHDAGGVSVHQITKALKEEGLDVRSDPRLKEFRAALKKLDDPEILDFNMWNIAVSKNRALIQKALTGALVVPDWKEFARLISSLAAEVEPIEDGDNAD
eukprot:996223_1